MPFYQDPPEDPDLWLADDTLRTTVLAGIQASHRPFWSERFASLGQDTRNILAPLARSAESTPPRLVRVAPWGTPVDRIETAPAWRTLLDHAARYGLVGVGHDRSLGPWRRVAQVALLHLFSPVSATASCPIAMSDAAATVLTRSADPTLRDAILPRLTSTDPAFAWTSGQWMTERPGGSDVSKTETEARPIPGTDLWTLHGWKWFTSATSAEVALTLARPVDGGGLTLFLVHLTRDAGGPLHGIRIERLKDKLGTRAMPTAELVLDGVQAVRIGPVGRGIATVAPMLNITRWHNAVSSAAGMRRAVALATDYAGRREASGRRLIDLPLHRWTLDGLDAAAAAATALVVHLAAWIGAAEDGQLPERESLALRALLPVAKATLGKAAVAVASEAIECFGGAGYVEDTDLPRMLRDAQVLPIWEGTTNVLAMDLLRAQHKERALDALFRSLAENAPATLTSAFDRARRLCDSTDDSQARTLCLWTGALAQAVLLYRVEGASQRWKRFVTDHLSDRGSGINPDEAPC